MHGITFGKGNIKVLYDCLPQWGFPGSSVVRIHLSMQETQVGSLGQEDSLGVGKCNPLKCSCLGNPVDRGAWWAAVHGIVRVGCDLVTEQQYLLRYFCILLIIYLLLYLEKRVACNKQLQFLFHLVSTTWIWSSSPD